MATFQAYVLMPYGANNEYEGGVIESEYIYSEIIQPGILMAVSNGSDKASIVREVDRDRGGSITASLVESIVTADVVVVDITGRNPNVFLELGMRYALRSKVTILMAQEGTDIPFDIQGYRYIRYNRFKPKQARERLSRFIQKGLHGQSASDSVVFDIFKSMSVLIPGVAESYGEEARARHDIMAWKEYMHRIEYICEFLEPPITEGHFVPDAILGITNGGLIVADLIGKRLFGAARTPILSLWAKRTAQKRNSPYWFFDNEYNDTMIENIKTVIQERHPKDPCTILLLDDHTGTGQTAVQAINYIMMKLGENTKVLFIPLVSRRIKYINVIDQYLPYNFKGKDNKEVFKIGKEEFLKQLSTKSSFFPYLNKEIKAGTTGE